MIRYAGIFRDVKLMAEVKDGVRNVVVTTVPDRGYRVWTVTVKGGDKDETFTLENPRLCISVAGLCGRILDDCLLRELYHETFWAVFPGLKKVIYTTRSRRQEVL